MNTILDTKTFDDFADRMKDAREAVAVAFDEAHAKIDKAKADKAEADKTTIYEAITRYVKTVRKSKGMNKGDKDYLVNGLQMIMMHLPNATIHADITKLDQRHYRYAAHLIAMARNLIDAWDTNKADMNMDGKELAKSLYVIAGKALMYIEAKGTDIDGYPIKLAAVLHEIKQQYENPAVLLEYKHVIALMDSAQSMIEHKQAI